MFKDDQRSSSHSRTVHLAKRDKREVIEALTDGVYFRAWEV